MSVLLFGATSLWGQGSGKLTGKILSIKNPAIILAVSSKIWSYPIIGLRRHFAIRRRKWLY